MNKIEQARRSIETAMARIGCPPGDNADADLYRDLQRSLAILKDMEAQERRRSCDKSCGPSDYCAGGKCDWMGCYTHPSPSAPVDIAEVIAAGDRAVLMAERCIDGAHAGPHSFLPGQYKDWKHGRHAWTTATAKHRTA